ncbi:MAG: hypothetical protein J7L11_10585 [Thermoprotei archaeon]|nr:hypothetical protein [Thermoprotei archaeon]
MAMDLLTFKTFSDFVKYIDSLIESTRQQLSEHLRHYDEIKTRAERIRSIEEVFSKILGARPEAVNEIDLKGLKIVIGARPTDEERVLSEVIKSLQDRLNVLMRIRKLIEPLVRSLGETAGIIIMVETLNAIPIKVLLKEAT